MFMYVYNYEPPPPPSDSSYVYRPIPMAWFNAKSVHLPFHIKLLEAFSHGRGEGVHETLPTQAPVVGGRFKNLPISPRLYKGYYQMRHQIKACIFLYLMIYCICIRMIHIRGSAEFYIWTSDGKIVIYITMAAIPCFIPL